TGGAYQYNEGVYYDTLQSVNSCDSIIETHLTVNALPPTPTIEIADKIIYSDATSGNQWYNIKGTIKDAVHQVYTPTGNDTLFTIVSNAKGCKSDTSNIIYFNTNTCEPAVNYIYPNICKGESYKLTDKNVNEIGLHIDSLISGGGCDSVIFCYLNVFPVQNIITDTAICEGDSILFNELYYSSDITVTDTLTNINGCDSTVTLNLKVYDKPQKPVLSQCEDMLYSSISIGNQWYNTNGPLIGEDEQIFFPDTQGFYYVIVTNHFGCYSQNSDTLYYLTTSKIDNSSNKPLPVTIYPNPSNNLFYLKLDQTEKIIEISVLNNQGQLLLNNKEQKNIIDLSMYPSGIYICKLLTNNGLKVLKLVKD
ncbi:T9SS type A sorting domain-containing protein, partial [Dolichospermum sp. ST_sed3]|nr:T9SS type A sorting domain-containing protein [Dolichospermum sp. ST_sed3]